MKRIQKKLKAKLEVPPEIEVYLRAQRILPKATRDAICEMIRCAVQLAKEADECQVRAEHGGSYRK